MLLDLDERLHRPDKMFVLAEVLAEAGVPAATLLEGSGLAPADLQQAATRVSIAQLLAVCERARRLSPDPALALRAGLRTRITHFGLYGYALLASPTPRQAIEVALRYRALASPLIGLGFAVDGDEAVWSFDDPLDLGPASAAFRFVVELQLGTLLALHRDLLGPTLAPRRVRLRQGAPAHAAAYPALLHCPADFEQTADELRFDAVWLDRPLAFANPASAEAARRTCEQQLAEIDGAAGLAGRVARRLLRTPGRFPDLPAVAAELGLHPRTLRRHLQAGGRSFQQLRDEVRLKMARDYLRDTRLSTEDIAAALGFSDAANFRHAFKRWSGQAPATWRQAQRGARPA